MKLKRILSGLIGLPIVAIILIFGNKYIVDFIISMVAIIAMHEYLKAFSKKSKPVKIIAYLSCFSILFLHIIPENYLGISLAIMISIIINISL